jgi:hypothetical protein
MRRDWNADDRMRVLHRRAAPACPVGVATAVFDNSAVIARRRGGGAVLDHLGVARISREIEDTDLESRLVDAVDDDRLVACRWAAETQEIAQPA